MAGTTFNLGAAQIAQATGCPLNNVERYWPAIQTACVENGLVDRAALIAVLATIATEVASFQPIDELGGDAYFTAHYEGRADLGNTKPGDGARYHGRGFIQITGRANYHSYGQKLGVSLEADPALALDPLVAARMLARYFKDHNIAAAAEAGDWQLVRKKVNGGLNGWDRFQSLVTRLEQAADKADGALEEGSIGPRIVQLKKLLEVWSKYHPLPQPLSSAPLFDASTTAAVKAFQSLEHIQPTGKVGQKTWDALQKAAAEIAATHERPH